ncbi:VWA domain-containing protein [Paracidobacterium acidisoli]|nr:VWA domain-containing protein [Paracidobacterium acidisoli]
MASTATAQAVDASSSQTPPSGTTASTQPATLKVDVRVVTMAVTVRDKKGAIVNNLTADDFALTDDNHPQTIKYFSHDTNLPLTLGLLVDTSMSQHSVLDDERTASQHFLSQMLTDPKDKAFLVQFDHEVDLLEDITPSKDRLQKALDQLGVPQFGSSSSQASPDDSDHGADGEHRRGRGGTTLYDAIYLASSDVAAKQPGRKALIVLTDGIDRGSKETLNGAVEAALRANTAIYAIYFKGEESRDNGNGPGMGRHGGMGGRWPGGGGGYPGGGSPGGYPGGGGNPGGGRTADSHGDGKKILEEICGRTGGYMFEGKKGKTDEIYGKISEELRGQYQLGYIPGKDASDSGYHRIALTPKKKDLIVQTHDGYYTAE